MTREIGKPPVSIHRRDLIDRAPHHVRAVKVFSKRTRSVINEVTSDRVQSWNLACRFGLPILSGGESSLFQKSIQQVAVMQFLDAPPIHKLPDDRIFACR